MAYCFMLLDVHHLVIMRVERPEKTAGKEVQVTLGCVSSRNCLNAFRTFFVHDNSSPDARKSVDHLATFE